jgi:hypothetical protein
MASIIQTIGDAIRACRYPAIVATAFAFALALTFKPAAVAIVNVLIENAP